MKEQVYVNPNTIMMHSCKTIFNGFSSLDALKLHTYYKSSLLIKQLLWKTMNQKDEEKSIVIILVNGYP
jgi:hypothetical protein